MGRSSAASPATLPAALKDRSDSTHPFKVIADQSNEKANHQFARQARKPFSLHSKRLYEHPTFAKDVRENYLLLAFFRGFYALFDVAHGLL
jgi:hypothetical protein